MKHYLQTLAYAVVLVFASDSLFAQLPFTQHPDPPGLTITTARMNDLQIDASNNKWIAFGNFGLGIYDGANWTVYNSGTSAIPSDSITAIAIESATNAWLGSREGVIYKDGSTFTLYHTGNSGLPHNIVTAVYDEPGLTWFGTYAGLASFDGTTWTTYNTSNSGIANDSVTRILRDATNRLWVGTRNGLSQYFNTTWTNYTTTNSQLDRCINDIITDNQDRLWVSSGMKFLFSQTTTGIHIISNSTVNNFVQLYLPDNPDLTYPNNIHFAKDISGNIYFKMSTNLTAYGLVRISGNNIDYFEHEYINMGLASFGNIFRMDSNNFMWTVPRNRFYFYSLDFNNYVYPLGHINFNNHRTLDINDVRAGINVAGDMHWDLAQPAYEVPKGSGKHSVFASALWIGGMDANGQLHGAAQTYRQTGSDYWPGPIGSISVPFDSSTCISFDRIWKVYKWRIIEFQNEFALGNVTNGSYVVPEEIATWPAKGNGIVNDHLAPFIDANSDGLYNPMDGDYPDIKGDQMLYYVFNDALAIHTETQLPPMNVEVQVKAYAYNCSNIADSNMVLNWTTFYDYLIINRGSLKYANVYTGFWSDMDLGNAVDDYVGCDSTRSAGFTYNGDQTDETVSGYGLYPPMQNIKILRGTLADDSDGIDNDLDGVTDEPGERTTMNHFMYYHNVNNAPTGNPMGGFDYYNYMQSIWQDNQHLTYGLDGRDPNAPLTNFMFSGVPYDPSGWTEFTSGNTPEDRRFIMGSGPVTLAAGDTLTFDFAYVFTRDSLNPNGLTTSIARNQADLDRVQYWFDTHSFPSCEVYTVSVPEIIPESISLHPNPATDYVYIKTGNKMLTNYDYTVYNLQGAEIMKGKLNERGIDVSRLSSQPYFLRIDLPSGPMTKKLIKM